LLHLASVLTSKGEVVSNSKKSNSDFAVIVTAFEQTHQLPEVINSVLGLDYEAYHIYVVADNCDVSSLDFYSSHPKVSVLRPENVLANNVKSHFYAIDRFIRPHNKLTIIDSDNLVDRQYLKRLDRYFDQGFQAV